uniref:Uncharacterized protein n=1 Tax=Anguilla anguilla TaxID=7936 RepID=A0A0E9Q7E9_ANGAN
MHYHRGKCTKPTQKNEWTKWRNCRFVLRVVNTA